MDIEGYEPLHARKGGIKRSQRRDTGVVAIIEGNQEIADFGQPDVVSHMCECGKELEYVESFRQGGPEMIAEVVVVKAGHICTGPKR